MRSLFARTVGRQHGRTQPVTNSQLEFPVLGPRFRLLVLADLKKDDVGALLELAGSHILIDASAGMVDMVRCKLLSVEPDLIGIDAAQSKVDGAC